MKPKPKILFMLGCAIILSTVGLMRASEPDIVATSHLDDVWAGHPVGFVLHTHSQRQFAAYYNSDRQMTVAMRELPDGAWIRKPLPEKVKWDSHNYITLAFDDHDRIHLSGNMHNNPIVYFITREPLNIETFERVPELVGTNEKRCTYPAFMRGPAGEFIFTYRDGGSGNGQQIYNVYDQDTGKWSRLLDEPLTDGEGKVSAYLHGPRKGPDDYYHLVYVWRETPDCATNRDLSYARSRDLRTWETSTGTLLSLPLTHSTSEVIDPVPPGGGLINGNAVIGFDSKKRPIVSYHKYDEKGNSQVYSARLEDGAWNIVQSTHWDWRWQFSGGGTIGFKINVGGVRPSAPGQLVQNIKHPQHSGLWEVDEETLQLLEKRTVPASRWPEGFLDPNSTFPGMDVKVAGDRGKSPVPGMRYVMRWETLPANSDRPRSGPLPDPSKLEVIGLR